MSGASQDFKCLVAAQKLIALAAVVTRKVVAIELQGPARK